MSNIIHRKMKLIKGTKRRYSINREGMVWSHPKNGSEGRWLKPYMSKTGYLQIKLKVDDKLKTFYIHRLVAETFIPNPEKRKCIRHKDGDKTNNLRSNLEWTTQSLLQRHYKDDQLLPCTHGDFFESLKRLHTRDIIEDYKEHENVDRLCKRYNARRDQVWKIITSMPDDEWQELMDKRAGRRSIRMQFLESCGIIKPSFCYSYFPWPGGDNVLVATKPIE